MLMLKMYLFDEHSGEECKAEAVVDVIEPIGEFGGKIKKTRREKKKEKEKD